MTTETYNIKLITPMFGGGVEPHTNDEQFPIRSTSIRGQLQFWWRATAGARYATKEELRKAQSNIWGSTKKASEVRLRILDFSASPPLLHEVLDPNNRNSPTVRNNPLTYALFPFQEQRQAGGNPGQSAAKCITSASFRLAVECPTEFWPDVENAVWAWVNFGGLGSRTRRGCGALYCDSLAPEGVQNLSARIKSLIQANQVSQAWPTLLASLQSLDITISPIEAWKEVIGLYRHFRQGLNFARDRGNGPIPGRSRYPEPETIRAIMRRPGHPRLPSIPDNAFPRAELGLPIVFHFQGHGEPDDTVLYPSGNRERMASPLILKPLALKNGQALPVILQLLTPGLDGIELHGGRPETAQALGDRSVIRAPSLATYPNSPLNGLSQQGSALEAFLNFSKSKGYQELPR